MTDEMSLRASYCNDALLGKTKNEGLIGKLSSWIRNRSRLLVGSLWCWRRLRTRCEYYNNSSRQVWFVQEGADISICTLVAQGDMTRKSQDYRMTF